MEFLNVRELKCSCHPWHGMEIFWNHPICSFLHEIIHNFTFLKLTKAYDINALRLSQIIGIILVKAQLTCSLKKNQTNKNQALINDSIMFTLFELGDITRKIYTTLLNSSKIEAHSHLIHSEYWILN